jgi:hypothetical protein
MKFLLITCALLMAVACSSKGLPPLILPDDSTPPRTVKIGTSLRLMAVFRINQGVSWSVDQPALATVQSDPKDNQAAFVTGIKPGVVMVYAEAGDNKAKIDITVIPSE